MDRQEIKSMKASELYSIFETWINSMINDNQEEACKFARALMGNHRTLQQSVIRFMWAVLLEYGKCATSDLRNEDSLELCQKLTFMVDKGELPTPQHLRYI